MCISTGKCSPRCPVLGENLFWICLNVFVKIRRSAEFIMLSCIKSNAVKPTSHNSPLTAQSFISLLSQVVVFPQARLSPVVCSSFEESRFYKVLHIMSLYSAQRAEPAVWVIACLCVCVCVLWACMHSEVTLKQLQPPLFSFRLRSCVSIPLRVSKEKRSKLNCAKLQRVKKLKFKLVKTKLIQCFLLLSSSPGRLYYYNKYIHLCKNKHYDHRVFHCRAMENNPPILSKTKPSQN